MDPEKHIDNDIFTYTKKVTTLYMYGSPFVLDSPNVYQSRIDGDTLNTNKVFLLSYELTVVLHVQP